MQYAVRAASFGLWILNEHAPELVGNGSACSSRIFEIGRRFLPWQRSSGAMARQGEKA